MEGVDRFLEDVGADLDDDGSTTLVLDRPRKGKLVARRKAPKKQGPRNHQARALAQGKHRDRQ
jgi:hypothetical protein